MSNSENEPYLEENEEKEDLLEYEEVDENLEMKNIDLEGLDQKINEK